MYLADELANFAGAMNYGGHPTGKGGRSARLGGAPARQIRDWLMFQGVEKRGREAQKGCAVMGT